MLNKFWWILTSSLNKKSPAFTLHRHTSQIIIRVWSVVSGRNWAGYKKRIQRKTKTLNPNWTDIKVCHSIWTDILHSTPLPQSSESKTHGDYIFVTVTLRFEHQRWNYVGLCWANNVTLCLAVSLISKTTN